MDKFEASVGSGFFGDMGTRASIMQDRAMKLLTTINAVTRSVLNILYDLKEFDQRLELYKDLKNGNDEEKKNARLALKQFWMDKVDIQRGRASLNMLSQQLQFVTLRDAFMAADTPEEVIKPYKEGDKNSGMDLNERVKRILAPRVADYLTWEKLSGKEIERRYRIERSYLKSQVESLKLYAQWAKPYFQAAQRLEQGIKGPDLVSTFNTLQVQTSLLGTKKSGKFFSCVEISFDFRTIPHTMKQTQSGLHYTQGGKVDMQFRAFALNEDEKKEVENYEFHEALKMANINEEMIQEIEESIKPYIEGEDEEFKDPREKLGFLQALVKRTKNKGKQRETMKEIEELKKDIKKGNVSIKKFDKTQGPFSALYDSVKDFPNIFKLLKGEKKPDDRGKALKDAVGASYLIYNVYKKAHGMYTE